MFAKAIKKTKETVITYARSRQNIRILAIVEYLFSLSYLEDFEDQFLQNHSKLNLDYVF